jgi:hypothetical protein
VILEQQQRPTFLQRLWQTLQRIIDWLLVKLRQPYQAMESYLVGGIAVWMLTFFANPRLFSLSPLYAPMAELGTPARWGRRALVLVVVWLVGAVTQYPPARYASQVILIGWYFFLFGMFASSGVVSFGAGIHLLGFVYAGWVLWRYAGRKQDVP